MAGRGRPKQALTLTDEERETLRRWSRRPKSPHSLAQRSRIVLECASGADNVTIDGLNTGGNSLTIRNTSSTSFTIRFANDASNNTIQNCTVEAGGGSTAI